MTEFAVLLLIPGLALVGAGISDGRLGRFLIGAVLVAIACELVVRSLD